MADVWANSMTCHPRATYHIAGCCHLASSMTEPRVTLQDDVTHSLTAALDQLRVVAFSTSNDPGSRSGQHQQIGQCLLPLVAANFSVDDPAGASSQRREECRCGLLLTVALPAKQVCSPVGDRCDVTWLNQCHDPEPRVTLQGAATWRIQCHDLRATLSIVLRRILLFVFLMQFALWRAAAFVSSPIHLVITAIILRTNGKLRKQNAGMANGKSNPAAVMALSLTSLALH